MSKRTIWTRASTEIFHTELTERATEIVDKLANNPGVKFTIPVLIDTLEFESEDVLRGILGELTKAAKRADIAQEDEHSWFILWEDVPEFRFWLNQH